MFKLSKLAGVLAAALFALMWAAPAQAQATRTWVSGVGDDVNPCSRTAPCKTFAGAISKTAAGGEINCLDPAGYGAVTITKSMSIICQYTEGGITTGVSLAFTVNAGASDNITLSGIDIECAGTGTYGVRFVAGGSLSVQDSRIRNCRAAGTGYGIYFNPSGTSKLTVWNTYIANNGGTTTGGGIHIQPTTVSGTALVSIANCYIENNGIGVQINGAGGGSPDYVTIKNTVITNNLLQGILETTNLSGIKLMLDGVESSNNGWLSGTAAEGLRIVGGASQAYVGRSTFTGNLGPGVTNVSGTLNSYQDNQNDLNGGASSAVTNAAHY